MRKLLLVFLLLIAVPVWVDAHQVVHTAIIFDCSGSMDEMRQEAIDAFNAQVTTLCDRESDAVYTITLAKFSTEPHPIDLFAEDVDMLALIGLEDYKPNGMTAMLDAVGATTTRMESDIYDIGSDHVSVLVIIISDGIENNSKEYDYSSIAERITRLQDTGRWTFVYIGANQDLSDVSARMSIPYSNMLLFTGTPDGMDTMIINHCYAVDAFLDDVDVGVSQSTSFFNSSETAE